MDAVEARGADHRPGAPDLPGPGELRDPAGDLWVRPENEPATYLWAVHLADQWQRSLFGDPIAFRADVALQFARELAAQDATLRPLALAESLQVIAGAALPLLQELHARRARAAVRDNKARVGRVR